MPWPDVFVIVGPFSFLVSRLGLFSSRVIVLQTLDCVFLIPNKIDIYIQTNKNHHELEEGPLLSPLSLGG